MEAVRRYEAWLQDPLIDEGTRLSCGGREQGRDRDRFKWLEFGTGGCGEGWEQDQTG